MGQPPQSLIAITALAGGELRGSREVAWPQFEQAWPVLERFVRRRLQAARLSPALLADCGQNVFLRIWTFRARYRGRTEGEFWAWVRTICDNERRRSQSRASHPLLRANREPESLAGLAAHEAASPGEAAAQSEARAGLHRCLNRLPAPLREVVELLYFPPLLTERAAAEALGVSPATVHKRKAAALRYLGDCLDEKRIEG